MPAPDVLAKSLISRAVAGVESAKNLDKALARIAGALYSTFYTRRVSLSLLVSHDQLVIAGLWTAQPTRLNKGMILRASATVLPEIVNRGGAISSDDCSPCLLSEALQQEDLRAWIAVPVPNARRVDGYLLLSARQNVFVGHREFFSLLGAKIGDRLLELSRRTETYAYSRELVLKLEQSDTSIGRPVAR
jgi:hypothetical protein